MRHTLPIVLATVALATLSAFAVPSLKIGGYVQVRYTDTIGAADVNKVSGYDENGTFSIRRARLAAKATINPQSMAVIEIDASQVGVTTKKAYIGYTFGDVYTTLGRNTIPFGYELQLSSSALLPLERSMISNSMPEYVTGLVAMPGSALVPVRTKLGIVNGDDPTGKKFEEKFNDQNNNKVLLANVEKPFGNTTVGASYITNSDSDDAVNGYLVYCTDKVYLAGEYIASDFNKELALNLIKVDDVQVLARNSGWYVLGAYYVNPLTALYARYDTLDNDYIDARDRVTVGVDYWLDAEKANKLTAEYQFIDDPANPALDGAFGVQMQTIF